MRARTAAVDEERAKSLSAVKDKRDDCADKRFLARMCSDSPPSRPQPSVGLLMALAAAEARAWRVKDYCGVQAS